MYVTAKLVSFSEFFSFLKRTTFVFTTFRCDEVFETQSGRQTDADAVV